MIAIRCALAGILWISAANAQTDDFLNALVAEGLQNNAGLHAMQHNVEALSAREIQVKTLEAPEAGLDLFAMPVRSFPIPAKGNMETDYFIQQKFPWPGKLSSMALVAAKQTGGEAQRLIAARNMLVLSITKAYYRLYEIQQMLRINSYSQQLAKSIADFSSRNTNGRMDFLRIQAEIVRLDIERSEMQNTLSVASITLDELLNREDRSDYPELIQPKATLGLKTADSLLQLAYRSRSELMALRYENDMYLAEILSAKKEFYPDLMVRGMYKQMAATTDNWAVMLSIDIPFAPWSRSKTTAKVREFEAHRRHSEMDELAARNTIRSEILLALVSLETADKQASEIDSRLIPSLKANLDALVISYQSGQTPLTTVLEGQSALLAAQIQYVNAVVRARSAEADLSFATGEIGHQAAGGHDHD